MQINIAFASIFQIPNGLPSALDDDNSHHNSDQHIEPRDTFATASHYRGTTVIPFFPNRTSFEDLYSGLEYRLNKYSQVHANKSTAQCRQRAQPHASTEGHAGGTIIENCRDDKAPETLSSSVAPPPLDPLFDTHCPHCKGAATGDHLYHQITPDDKTTKQLPIHENDVNLEATEYDATSKAVASVSMFPVISVISVRRRLALSADIPDERLLRDTYQQAVKRGEKDLCRTPYSSKSDFLVMPRDAQSILSDEVMHFNVFFQSHMFDARQPSSSSSLLEEQGYSVNRNDCPIITANGMTHRSAKFGVDHCPQFLSDPKPVEVVVRVASTKPSLRFRFPDIYTVRDLMIRLEQTCGGRVGRIVDTDTGAAILPCEVLGHVVWKLRSRMAAEWFPFPSLVSLLPRNNSDANGDVTQPNSTQLLTLEFLHDESFADDGVDLSGDTELGLHEYGLQPRSAVEFGGQATARKRPRDDSSVAVSHQQWDLHHGNDDDEHDDNDSDDQNEIIYMDDEDNFIDGSSIGGDDTITVKSSVENAGESSGVKVVDDLGSNASTYRLFAHSSTTGRAGVGAVGSPNNRSTSRKLATHSSQHRRHKIDYETGASDEGDDASIRLSEFGGHESAAVRDLLDDDEDEDEGEDHGTLDNNGEDPPRGRMNSQRHQWMTSAAPLHRRDEQYLGSEDEEGDDEHSGSFVTMTQPIEYAKIHMSSLGDDDEDIDDDM